MSPENSSTAPATPQRTLSAIRGKISSLRRDHPELWDVDGKWDGDKVVQFLYRLPFIDPAQVIVLLDSALTEITQIKSRRQVSSGPPKVRRIGFDKR
jgi:hypothetical protein